MFNQCVDHFIDKLKGLANSPAAVPMTNEFGSITLNIIAKV